MNPKNSTTYRFKSIQSLFIAGMILLIAVISLPLIFFGTTIISNLTRNFGQEILTEELNSLIQPINLRYKTLTRIGLEDSESHLQEIKKEGLEELRQYRYKQTGNVFVIGKDGVPILAADFDRQSIDFKNLRQTPSMIEYQAETQQRIGVAVFYPAWNSYIGLTMDRQELFAPRTLFIKIGISVFLVLLLLASVCITAIYRFIVSPVLRLTHYAEQVSQGNLQAEIPGKFIFELATVKKDIMGMVRSLINREKKYRTIFNAPSDAIVLHEAKSGKILEVNDAIYPMYGYTPEEFLTMSIGDFSSGQPPYTLEEAGKRMAQLQKKKHLSFEWQGKRKNGDFFWVDVSLRPLLHDGKECVLAVVRDIDDKKKASENLAAEKEQLAITLRSIGDGVITTDNHGRIVLLNRIAEQITGWSQHEAAGQSLDNILHLVNSKDDTPSPNPASEVLATGLHIELSEDTVLIARNGSRKNISDSAAPIFDTNSNIVGVVLVFRDTTEKRKLEKELLKIKKIESVGVLAGGIAHDFNNLLSAILGNINLSRTMMEKDSHPYLLLAEAEKASLRARHLTQQLLTFSKGGEPVRETTDLMEIITDNAGFVLRGTQIQLNLNIPDDLWQVDIDPGQIGQVVQNILINSRQAMDQEGNSIEIAAHNCDECAEDQILAPSCIQVTITDNGPGIPPNTLEKIFDPYFSTKKEGSGLGLAICHSIIQKHDGILRADSSPGGGTTFTIKLPKATVKAIPQRSTPRPGTKQNNLKILLMDDEKILLDVGSEMLTFLGHRCKTAFNGTEALRLFREAKKKKSPFDVVIMDLTIPGGMGGEEAVAKLLALDPLAKVIVSSGYSTDPIMANYKDYGFTGILVKPFNIQDLEAVL